MKLIETYALQSGLKIDKPILVEEYFPIVFDNYITLHAGGGDGKFASKCYDFWNEVVFLLKKRIKEPIVQIGSDKENLIAGIDLDLRGKTKVRQTFYLIKRAKLHFGNDSFGIHVAGACNTPVVSVYGPTTVANHGPYWKNNASILLESHRDGKKCSFSSHENKKTINLVTPEEIANSILQILNYEKVSLVSKHLGQSCFVPVIEYIPDFVLNPQFNPDVATTARADYDLNEECLYNTLAQRKLNIITDKPLNVYYLKMFRQNVAKVNYEVTEKTEEKHLQELKNAGVPINFFSRATGEALNQLRFKFFEAGNINFVEEDLNKFEANKFRTNKILVSQSKVYPSYAHYLEKKPAEDPHGPFDVIDRPEFWKDKDFYWIFND